MEKVRLMLLLCFVLNYYSIISGVNCTLGEGTNYPVPGGNGDVSIAISPDGSFLVISRQNTVLVASKPIVTFRIVKDELQDRSEYTLPSGIIQTNGVCISPDGDLLAIPSVRGVSLFKITDYKLHDGIFYPVFNQTRSSTSLGSSSAASFSPDGSLLATTGCLGDASLALLSVTNGTLKKEGLYPFSIGGCFALAFSPNGKMIVVTPMLIEDSISVYTVNNNTLINATKSKLPNGAQSTSSPLFSPDGSLFATAGGADIGGINVFNVVNGTLTNGINYPLPLPDIYNTGIAFSPDGSMLASANGLSNDNDITLFNVQDGALVDGRNYLMPPGAENPTSLTFSPDGKLLIIANQDSDFITVVPVKCTDSSHDAGSKLGMYIGIGIGAGACCCGIFCLMNVVMTGSIIILYKKGISLRSFTSLFNARSGYQPVN